MGYLCTTATRKIAAMRKKVRAIPGGTSAGKTIAILQILIDLAQTDKEPTITSVTSESVPHLKLGAMRDFINIMQSHGYWDENRWNATDRTYEFETKSKIEFFPFSEYGKCKGPRRQRLYVNEANHCPHDNCEQLMIRTSGEVFIDWNPDRTFWYYDLLQGQPDVEELTLTYLDNEGCPPATKASIEAKRGNARWWRVYGEGKLGEAIGQIFTGWRTIDELPHEARLIRRGMDFGYTNDPTSIVAIYRHDGGYILDEECYRTGMLNGSIADLLMSVDSNDVLVKADSAEPKSIEEIRQRGVNIVAVKKGSDSILHGITKIQGLKISVTSRSVNLLKEYRGYYWLTDKAGKSLNQPQEFDNHAIDAARYGFEGIEEEDNDLTRDRHRQFLNDYYQS